MCGRRGRWRCKPDGRGESASPSPRYAQLYCHTSLLCTRPSSSIPRSCVVSGVQPCAGAAGGVPAWRHGPRRPSRRGKHTTTHPTSSSPLTTMSLLYSPVGHYQVAYGILFPSPYQSLTFCLCPSVLTGAEPELLVPGAPRHRPASTHAPRHQVGQEEGRVGGIHLHQSIQVMMDRTGIIKYHTLIVSDT